MPAPLTALSRVDSPYAAKLAALCPQMSEYGLVCCRMLAERCMAVSERGLPEFAYLSAAARVALDARVTGSSEADAQFAGATPRLSETV